MKRSLFSVITVLIVSAVSALADTADVIAKARAYLGPEKTLNSFHSLKVLGTGEEVQKQEDGTEKRVSFGIEIIIQKPFQRRIVLTGADHTETTALDDYEAWQRLQDKKDPSRWRTTLFPKNKVKQLRADTWENLAFFRGIEEVGGTIEDRGIVQLDGKPAHKLAFVHEPGIVYVRYFDPETGRLMLTETDSSVRVREEGEMMVNGIRFPKRIVNTTTQGDGRDRVVIVNIEQVIINEEYPRDIFSVPLISPK
jgi:hypothetical protein